MDESGTARPTADEIAALVSQWGDAPGSGFPSPEQVHLLESLLGAATCARLGIYSLPDDFLLSVVIPVFNEVETIGEVVRRVRATGIPLEMVVVDDASTDGARELLAGWNEPDVRVILQPRNQGKGAALRAGFAASRGTVLIVQDADLEYDPADFRRLIQPIVQDRADVVYGSRFSGGNHEAGRFWHFVANRVLTVCSNAMTNLRLTDMETCYKAFRGDIVRRLAPTLRENRFGIEPEITAKVARVPGVRVQECSISYVGRNWAEGKKITWRDGVRALWCIVRYAR